MKQILLVLLLAVALPIAAQKNDCKVPISVQLIDATNGKVKKIYDSNWERVVRYFERKGFTAEVYSTRIGISLVASLDKESCEKNKKKMNVEVMFIDSYADKIFYSAQLDKYYCGSSYSRQKQLMSDLEGSFPQLDSLADTIRTCIVNSFEANTRQVATIAHEHASKDEHEIALFTLVQYPTCCPSYPKMENLIVAIFRDYMIKDNKALIHTANNVLLNKPTEADARFVVSLLNSVQFSEYYKEAVDGIFAKIASKFPEIDLKANKDYSFDAELRPIAIREARNIGVFYGQKEEAMSRNDMYDKSEDFFNRSRRRDYDDDDDDWYPEIIKGYDIRIEQQQFRGANDSYWKK